MAGDWIKVRVDLVDDPDVFVMSDKLSIECPTTVGHLLTFWGWLDRHTADGKMIKLTKSMIDRRVGVDGFAEALKEVGWLSGVDMAFEIPNHDRHNGSSAKARALESEAKRIRRNEKEQKKMINNVGQNNTDNVGQVSDKTEPKCPTREDKRRDINNTQGKQKISDDFKPDESTLEYCKFKNLPEITDDVISIFIHSNKSSGWRSADWQSEFKNWLHKQKVRYEENKARYDNRAKSKRHSGGQSGGFLELLRDVAGDC